MPDLPRIARKHSRIAGSGVFALEPIPRKAPIRQYRGELVDSAECLRREQRYLPRGRIWMFNINARWARDAARGGNIARYINHSCRPNCHVDIFGQQIWIFASRDIPAGEELSYDYNTDGVAGIACRCRPACKRVL